MVVDYTCPCCAARFEVSVERQPRSYSLVGLAIDWLRPANPARMFALARCPACNARPPLAFVWAIARIAGNALVGAALATAIVALVLWFGAKHAGSSDIGVSSSVVIAVFALYGIPLVFATVALFGEIMRFGTRLRAARGPMPRARILDKRYD